MKSGKIGIVLLACAVVAVCGACSNSKKENKGEDSMKTGSTEKTLQLIQPKEINENAIKLIGDRWMLVTAGDSAKFNMMTANWGAMGYLWNKPVVFIFIRPQRYTFGFLEENPSFTLSFFEAPYRKALEICGSASGRDGNKVEKSGLTPQVLTSGNVTFEEADLVLECRKLYADFLNPEAFIDKEIFEKVYTKEEGIHKVFVAEIVNAWQKK